MMTASHRRRRADRLARDSELVALVRLVRGEVEILDRAAIPLRPDDPESPLGPGRRARVTWVPDTLRENGGITKPQWEAARRYRDDWETAEMPATPARSAVHGPGGGPGALGYAEARVKARADFQGARGALANGLADIAAACVLGNASLRSYADARRWQVSATSAYLRAALEVLEHHYGAAKRQRVE